MTANPHWLIDYAHFHDMGLNDTEIAAKFGISTSALDKRFRRLNRKPGHAASLAPVVELPTRNEVAGLVDQSIEDAADIITRIREEDPHDLWIELANMPPARVLSLVYALAAMVPTDKPMSQLLAWTNHLAEAS